MHVVNARFDKLHPAKVQIIMLGIISVAATGAMVSMPLHNSYMPL